MSITDLLSSVSKQDVELWVEGSRLRFRGPRGALSTEQREMLTSRRRDVIDALRARAASQVRFNPLSYNQRALWFIAQGAPDSAAYNVAVVNRILSSLDAAIVGDVLQGLTDRHAMLRTTYGLGEDGEPVQRTAGSIDVAFDVHDVTGVSDAALQDLIRADYQRPFDLERGPVFRAALYARGPQDHVLLVVVHHIAADARSLGILADDFRQLYAEATGLSTTAAPRAERDYADFVAWQGDLLEGPDGEGLASYWQSCLQGPRAEIDLPSDRPRPAIKSFRGATRSVRLDADLVAGLREQARSHSTTLFVVALAAFDAMLFRLTGVADLVVGTPTSGRGDDQFSRVVGHFVNPVPLRTPVRAGMTFRELLGCVRQTVREALDHQDYPLFLMVQDSHPVRNASRSPLFETFFSVLNVDQLRDPVAGSAAQEGQLRFAPFPLDHLEGQFDLSVQLVERSGSVDVELRFSTDLLDETTANRFLKHYVSLLEAMTRSVDTPIDSPSFDAAQVPPPDSVEAFLAELAAHDIRLTLDGEKLRVSAPAGAVDGARKAALAERKSEIIAVLRAASARSTLRPVTRTVPLPISFAQQRHWFIDRMQPGSALYNVPLALRLRGSLNERAMVRAIEALVQRHEVLRTCLREVAGNPAVEIRNDVQTRVRIVDVSDLQADARTREAMRLVKEHASEPFDLATGPMAAFLLLRCAADEHLLVICIHHIAADGWSLSVAAREIAALYDAEVAGRPSPLAPFTLQYVDFAAWQREQLSTGMLARQLSYWQRELAGAPTLLELPTDRPRPAVQSFRGGRRIQHVREDLYEALKALARAQDVTLYMLLLGAWQVLLSRHSGQEDIVVGSPMANRDRPELEGLIGCFVNNVVIRGRLDGNPRFTDFLNQVKATVLRAFDHRELPFDRVVEALKPERSTSHTPLFQTLFTLHSFPVQALRPTGLEVELVQFESGSSRFDVTLDVDEHEGALRMAYEYATDLFDAATIDRLHAQYVTLLGQIASDVNQTVRDIPLLTAEDEQLLLARVNDAAFDHDRSRCVHDLVREAAERSGSAVAVEASDDTLTYVELERRANQFAHLLRRQGVEKGTLVGVCLDRSSLLPVALLGVLKAGAAYVPVDPSHPADRLAHTLVDAQVACVVTEDRFAALVAGAAVPLVLVDEVSSRLAAEPGVAPDVDVAPHDLAYVIYTSGSTGRPKGVEIEHQNFVNLLEAMRREPGLRADDVLLAVTTPSFDIAGLELFLPLVCGARLVIADRVDVLDGERLRKRLRACGATMMQATPAIWRLLVDAGWEGEPGLTALCGGEALPRDLARDLSSRVRALWNMYGPTETTIWSTVHEVTDHGRDIPIGHPIANTTVYVLDAAGRPAPIGVAGELCIGGEGVARGYRQRDELTSEKFVTVALAGREPERVYRTGDVVRLRSDLTLEFVGRRDHQVKLRGHRIELGEIESVIAAHPSIRRVVAIVRDDERGDRRLVAYFVPTEGAQPPIEELRTLLRSRLPEYMVPSAIVPLAALPLTPNGKVDRKALPVPSVARATSWAQDTIMTDTQRRIAAIWCSVLRVDRVGLHENFFDLGGHSLLVINVHAALRREFPVDITVIDLFQSTTIAAQAALVSETGVDDAGLQRAKARVARQVFA